MDIPARNHYIARAMEDYTCPLSRRAAIDLYFLEHRAKLLDIAAFLDRIERCRPEPGEGPDFRLAAFRQAVAMLLDEHPERARRIHELLSDPTTQPLASAAGLKGAHGAYRSGGASR
jgi:hypothetical protein